MAITLTQDTYRLWARIGYVAGVTDTDINVLAQLAQLELASIAHQTP
jgi:hypothetical protein